LDYPLIYASYASPIVHFPGVFGYEKCHWWTFTDGALSMVADFVWPWQEQDRKEWQFHSGDGSIRFDVLPDPTEILRVRAPEADPAAMYDYSLNR
ncbi:MAG: hypothetical protein AAGA62_07895, partial [Bacteroidota bacterium]